MADLASVDWYTLSEGDTDQAYSAISNTLEGSVNTHLPTKQVTIPAKMIRRQPWLSSGLVKTARTKNKLYKYWKYKLKANEANLDYHDMNTKQLTTN